MELLCVLAAVAALFCGCAVLTLKCRVPASVAPLTALSAIVAVLTLAAMAGVLYPAAWLLYLLCLAGGVWVAASCRGSTGAAQRLFTPGSVLFWGMALAFTVYFFVRQPMATDFDELSLWATAVKITKVNDSLYATAELGTPWAATQNPGLPLLAYFFQFFGDYADWKIYVGYDILYFSVFAAVVGAVPREKWRVAVPMAAVLWCVPFFFTNYNHTIYLTTTYMTSYGDVPAGLVFGGAVAAWLALRQNSAPKWAVLPILALSANIKANTFVLALVAAGLVAVDEWLFADDGDFKAGLLPRTGFSLACFAAPMAIYYLWNVRYVGWLVSRSASDSGVGETSAPLSAVVVNGIKILLGQPVEGFYAEREAQFRTAMADMGHQFWTSDGKLSMIGQGRNVVALIAIVFVVAILAAASRRLKARIAVIGALSGVCFLGYNLMLALSYGFIFKTFQAEQLTDYYNEHGIKVRYLHSDIDTVERVEILRDLRLGVFDVLVGINLLREGLDIPEVSLVAILDADKEGFLRSERSLIQTIGRAARNLHGKAILYADRITGSMERAIGETERRREKQLGFNAEHGIVPRGVQKRIKDIIDGVYSAESQARQGKAEALDEKQLAKRIKETEKAMMDAARDLRFEDAARLRDSLRELKQRLFGEEDV